MTEKVCPRCGAMYEDLKSTTCPQCFAKLLIVDEATADELRAAREAVEQTPEFQAAKTEDDERFREQSFGACLGVLVIALLTALVIAAVIGLAVRRHHALTRPATISQTIPSQTTAAPDILTRLPVAAATLDDVLPAAVGPYTRLRQDQDVTLSGTQTPLFHAAYSSRGETLQVYAVPTSLPTSLQNQFRQGVELAARIETDKLERPAFAPTQTFATEHWRYAAIGPASETADTTFVIEGFRQALAAHFRQLDR